MEIKKINFQIHGDERGQLVAVEENKEIPFEIKRIYYMYGMGEGVRRGFHAHKALEQVLICICGSCKILLDDGNEKAEVCLANPAEGLFVGNKMWHEMYDYSEDAILMSIASDLYNESDYIRNYDDFLKYMKDNNSENRGGK